MHEQIRTCTLRSNDLERHWNLEAELSVCHRYSRVCQNLSIGLGLMILNIAAILRYLYYSRVCILIDY